VAKEGLLAETHWFVPSQKSSIEVSEKKTQIFSPETKISDVPPWIGSVSISQNPIQDAPGVVERENLGPSQIFIPMEPQTFSSQLP
jgi:hypothetical protein